MTTSIWRNPVALGIFALLLLILAASTFAVVPETKHHSPSTTARE